MSAISRSLMISLRALRCVAPRSGIIAFGAEDGDRLFVVKAKVGTRESE